jgi:hypothetical protein
VKKLLFAVILVMSCSAQAQPSSATPPIEKGAIVDADLLARAPEMPKHIAVVIRLFGYRCDSISQLRPMFGSRGYVVACNEWAYKYDVEDRGGKWEVKLK